MGGGLGLGWVRLDWSGCGVGVVWCGEGREGKDAAARGGAREREMGEGDKEYEEAEYLWELCQSMMMPGGV